MTDDLVAWLRGVLTEDEVLADLPGVGPFWHADIEAKRAILDRYQAFADLQPHEIIGSRDAVQGIRMQLLSVVKTLASAYRDRPGYREEWAPEK